MSSSTKKKHAEGKALIHFLEEPTNFPHQPKEVKIIQTHASILAIAPPYVYKFKKQLDFGFMDFRNLETRRQNCERELDLNRRLCKQIYLGLVPLYKNQNLSFQQTGQIVDYALLMKQLDDGFFLHQILEKEELTKEMLESVMQVLRKFYEAQPSGPSLGIYAVLPLLRSNAEENFTSLKKLSQVIGVSISLEVIKKGTRIFLQQQMPLFLKRQEEHKIKDCHGDLHLEHIHIRNGQVCIFDCIEFNERYRFSDVAADIAFLAMDLDFYGRPDLSSYVVTRMAEFLQDPDMLLLMDYYKSYRACVRAKVEGIRSRQEDGFSEGQEHSRQNAKRYLQLALRYTLFGSKPWVLIVCGKIGSGKSTIANHLAFLLGVCCLSSDMIRKESTGRNLYQRTVTAERSFLYEEKKTDEVYQQLSDRSLTEMKNLRSIVVDATFHKKVRRQMFMEPLQERQYNFCFIETRAPEQLIKERLKERETKTVISDARLDDFERLDKAYESVCEIPAQHFISINTAMPIEKSMRKVLNHLMKLQ